VQHKRRILVTNDDGIASPGIRRLAQAALDLGHEVVVAAPRTQVSGSSASLSAAVRRDGGIPVEERPLAGLPAVPSYGVAASPAYIVQMAVAGAFGPRPEIVLSGINLGCNAGHAVLHSGTVGAALTGVDNGCRAMAVSLNALAAEEATEGHPADAGLIEGEDAQGLFWRSAAWYARVLLPILVEAPERTMLNLNVPNTAVDEIRGLRRCALAPFGQTEMVVSRLADGAVGTAVSKNDNVLTEGSDLACLDAGFATVTPLRPVTEAVGFELPV
jgi:5'-nucleotidase